MDLEKIRLRISKVLENHRKHGLLMDDSLALMRAGADIALIITKWEMESEARNEREIISTL